MGMQNGIRSGIQAKARMTNVLKLLGEGWTGETWENDGWHVKWYNGAVQLRYSYHQDMYWAMVGWIGETGGLPWLMAEDDERMQADPRRAIQVACETAMAIVNQKVLPMIGSLATMTSRYE